jgi:coronin-1B/1C/6
MSLIRFHPSADFTLASAACDNTVKIWDIQKQESTMTYADFQGNISAMSWNFIGSNLVTASKDKKVRVFDPRNPGTAQVADSHAGIKP